MTAKLIRTEKTEWGDTKYFCECSVCGNEYYRWNYNKRTTCYCLDCYNKRQRENAKAWQKRKQQECVDKVLEEIKTEIDEQYKWLMQTKHTLNDIDIAFSGIKSCINKHIR